MRADNNPAAETNEQRIGRQNRENEQQEKRTKEADQQNNALNMARYFYKVHHLPEWKKVGEEKEAVEPAALQSGKDIKILPPGIYKTEDGKSVDIMLKRDGSIAFPSGKPNFGDAIDFIRRAQGSDAIVISVPQSARQVDMLEIKAILDAAESRRVKVRFDDHTEGLLDNFRSKHHSNISDSKRDKLYQEIQDQRARINQNYESDKPAKDNFLEMGRHQRDLQATEKLPTDPAARQEKLDKILNDATGQPLPPEEQAKAIMTKITELDTRVEKLNKAKEFLTKEVEQAPSQEYWQDPARVELLDKTNNLRGKLMTAIQSETTDVSEVRQQLDGALTAAQTVAERHAEEQRQAAAVEQAVVPPPPPPPPPPVDQVAGQQAQAAAQPADQQPAAQQPAPVDQAPQQAAQVAPQAADQPAAQPAGQAPQASAPPAPEDPFVKAREGLTSQGEKMQAISSGLEALKREVSETPYKIEDNINQSRSASQPSGPGTPN